MKRTAILGIAVFLAGCLVIALGWIGFMTFQQSRVATVRVSVAGSVDEVAIYKVSYPTQAVASVRTSGQQITTEIKLPAARKGFTLVQPLPEEYFFVSTIGDQHYQGPKICCMASLFPEYRILTVRGLSDWEVRSK